MRIRSVFPFLVAASLLLFAAGSAPAQEAASLCEPDPTCRQECRVKSQVPYQECIAAGGSYEHCRLVRGTYRRACLASECGPRLGCEERCEVLARRMVQRCLEAGGELDDCNMDGRKAFHVCIESKCQVCGCPRIYEPVCGTDGMTYPNACEASCAGVDIRHAGRCEPQCRPLPCDVFCEFGYVRDANGCPTCECKPPPGCESDADCAEDQTCRKLCPAILTRPCIEGSECPPCVGVCLPKPDPCLCTEQYEPVCGVDGVTYDNKCFARCAEVEIAHPGECRIECRDNGDCLASKQICYPPTGLCQPRCAIQCFRYDPVCGTDGVTYGCGAADAHCNGVEVAHEGACYACPQIYDPVCGVDGKTYGNRCFAEAARVEVAHAGECAPACPALACDLFCPTGFAVAADGCPQCRCNPDPITIITPLSEAELSLTSPE